MIWATRLVARLLVLGVIGPAVIGCGTEPDRGDIAYYYFRLDAIGGDTTPDRIRIYDCRVMGDFSLATPVSSSGTVRFPVSVGRTLTEHRGNHAEFTRADTSITEAVLEYSGLNQDTLRFTFGAGPYVVAPEPGGREYYADYSGDWTCGPSLPLANDSTLNAYGYDPNLEIPGHWTVIELRPIE
jgi:hypothetical protein